MAALAATPAAALAKPAEPPVVVFTAGLADGVRTNQNDDVEFIFEADGDDTIASYSCTVDGGEPDTNCGQSLWFDELADGEHTVSVTATDVNGLESAPAVRKFTIDATGPAPTLATLPNTLPPGPIALSGTAGAAAFDNTTIDVLVMPYVEGMQHSLDPVWIEKVPVVDGRWSVTTAAIAPGTYIVGVDQFDDLWNYGHAGQQITVAAPAPTPAPTPAPVPARVPVTPQPAPVTKPIDPATTIATANRDIAKTLTAGGIDGLLKRPTTTATFQAPGAGTVTVLYRARNAKGKVVLVATGTKSVTRAGNVSVAVKLTKAGRAALKQSRRASLTVTTSFKAKGAKLPLRSSRTVTLKRK